MFSTDHSAPSSSKVIGSVATNVNESASENCIVALEGSHVISPVPSDEVSMIVDSSPSAPLAVTLCETDDRLLSVENVSDIASELNHDYFSPPSNATLTSFLEYHPQQNTDDVTLNKLFTRKDGTNRKWLSYSMDKQKFFCFICLAFKSNESSIFVSGAPNTDRRHLPTRVIEHEISKLHQESTNAFIRHKSNKSVNQLLLSTQLSLRNRQIQSNREIIKRLIDILKLIGKRGLAYRGSEFEAAYTLSNENIDHGNFLELMLFLSKYDSFLSEHVQKCVVASSEQRITGKGRGSFITFFSKTTVNKIILIIARKIRTSIVRDIHDAGIKFTFCYMRCFS